jgi:D-glycerate 3-kinase
VAVLGIDEFYLPTAARQSLARAVHPLCATRGPPGTHDLALLHDCITALQQASPGSPVAVPRFSKPADDRLPRNEWASVPARPDAIIVEGWLMGVLADGSAPQQPPLNPLEAQEDGAGIWRGWQETALEGDYAELWNSADAFLHLRAPSFAIVSDWRSQQEESNLGLAPGTLPPDRRAWVARFVQHYERLTRRLLSGTCRPGTAIPLDNARNPRTAGNR